MLSTLIELERIHKCPMVVKDVYDGVQYYIHSAETPGSTMFKASPMSTNHRGAPIVANVTIPLYGGYVKWTFISKPDIKEISPEEQKRLRAEERKNANDKILRDLRRTSAAKTEPPKKSTKVKSKSADESNVIPFKPRPKG